MIDPYHIYATGMNNYGQLGTGNLENQIVFTLIGKVKGKNIRGVVAGGHHSFFLIDPEEPEILNY